MIEINYEKLGLAYMLSNTTSHLLDQFRADDSIVRLSEVYSSGKLINIISQISDVEKPDYKQKLAIYAILISLTLKRDKKAREYFLNPPKLPIEHLNEICAFYLATIFTSNSFEGEAGRDVPQINKHVSSQIFEIDAAHDTEAK